MSRLIALSLFTLAGCDFQPGPALQMREQSDRTPAEDSRFRVERASVFSDSLAYNGTRGIYLLTDKLTGREYVGVSGVGIAELDTIVTTSVEVDGEGNVSTHTDVEVIER